jgi:hypothetical protein
MMIRMGKVELAKPRRVWPFLQPCEENAQLCKVQIRESLGSSGHLPPRAGGYEAQAANGWMASNTFLAHFVVSSCIPAL